MHSTADSSSLTARTARLVRSMWRASAPLTAVGLAMLVIAIPSAIGILVDPRIITGAPAWLKPFKFATSIAIYCLTTAWIFTYLDAWPRMRRAVGWIVGSMFVLEIIIIDTQAWRGTTSHFNTSTPLDGLLFSIMGAAILVQTLASGAVAVALWRQRFADPALGAALRAGMILTILGASTGSLMTRQSPEQREQAERGERLTTFGAHTVGAPDGGPGIPLTGWSREHGDVRVAHFVGLHALQALALVALGLARWRRAFDDKRRLTAVRLATASYATLFLLLLSQALRGQSIVAPDATTIALFTAWGALSALGFGWILSRPRASTSNHQRQVIA